MKSRQENVSELPSRDERSQGSKCQKSQMRLSNWRPPYPWFFVTLPHKLSHWPPFARQTPITRPTSQIHEHVDVIPTPYCRKSLSLHGVVVRSFEARLHDCAKACAVFYGHQYRLRSKSLVRLECKRHLIATRLLVERKMQTHSR